MPPNTNSKVRPVNGEAITEDIGRQDINTEDYDLVFETRGRRSDVDPYLTSMTVLAFLEGPSGQIGEVARLTTWRYAPGYFEFCAFDEDLYWVFDAVSVDKSSGEARDCTTAETAAKLLMHKDVLVRSYDDRQWGDPECNVPVGLVIMEPPWAEPALRGTGISLRLACELREVLCGPYAAAGIIRPLGHHPPDNADAEALGAWEREHAHRLRRMVEHFTSWRSLGLDQVVPEEPALVTGYWPGHRTCPTEDDHFIELTEPQIRQLLGG